MKFLLTWLFALGLIASARAQIPPSPAELANYAGLHAAAADGDVAAIKRLVAAGANLEATDSDRRTPLLVAVFMHRHEAARALLQLGANPNALDAQKYDIVTIAAVDNDVEM